MGHIVDISKGALNSALSHQWATRPSDQRYLTLESLYQATDRAARESFVEGSDANGIEAFPTSDNKGLLFSIGGSAPIAATNFAFGQVAGFAGAPARYLASLPADLAAKNLNFGLMRENDEEVSRVGYIRRPAIPEGQPHGTGAYMRGFTSPKYGRIYDRDVVAAVMKLVEMDPRWKVPGVMDWSTMIHNPNVDVTKDTTTLYASDRDLFAFLCDDAHPVEVGKTRNGDPDMLFRGFYVTNSEIGAGRFSLSTMYLRGVCQNRNLWGVEGFTELKIRHTKGAPIRFMEEAVPALATFAELNTNKLINGVKAAKAATVATNDEERENFLRRLGFSKRKAILISDTHEIEEGKKPENVWEMAQGITAVARSIPHQDARIDMERIAGNLLDKVAVAA